MLRSYRAWRDRRQARDDVTVLGCLMLGDQWYVDIWRRTGLGSGRIYPALVRLARAGLVRSEWDAERGKPPRVLYRPTDKAEALFRQHGDA